MMGLPAGWVTEVPDLTRVEQLKALGNGVVPQQAAAAVRFMLTQRGSQVEAHDHDRACA
jgi:DNA (cytosine-5)-methyltransferase 1